MPRGVPKSASSASVASSSSAMSLATHAPPPTRVASSRSAKVKANASILEHDTDIDALIRKHDKKGARGFAKARKETASEFVEEVVAPRAKRKQTRKVQDEEMDVQHDDQEQAPKKGKRDAKTASKKKAVASEDDVVMSGPSSGAKTRATSKEKATAKAGKRTGQNSNHNVKDALSSTPPRKAVLGESNQPNNSKLLPFSSEVDPAKVSASSLSPSKSYHASLAVSPVRPVIVTPTKKEKMMPGRQISSFLENYDLEAENRIRMAHKTLQISVESARTQMHAKAIAKLPRTVRLMRMADFLTEYEADVQAVVERAAVVANRAREGAWEEEKLQRKRKGDDESKEATHKAYEKTKSARLDANGSAAAESSKATLSGAASAVSTVAAQAKRGKGKKASSTTTKRLDSRFAVPQSPIREAHNSTVRPPSTAVFSPQFARGTVIAGRSSNIPVLPPTPAGGKGRAARAGERVQWMSMNGSPIIGIVGPDGAVHSMPRTIRRSPSALRSKQSSNWQAIGASDDEDEGQDAAETSAHLLELAKGIDGFRRSRISNEPVRRGGKTSASADVSPASQMSLHTAQASRRATLEAFESDDGESVFEEARSRPDDDDEDVDESLPDEAEYMAQVMREEARKRSRMLASEPRIARSSASSRAYGARSSGSSSIGSTANVAAGRARASQATIRAASRRGDSEAPASSSSSAPHHRSSSSSLRLGVPSSPMIRSSKKLGSASLKGSSSLRAAAAAPSSPSRFSSSSSPSKGRVSIVFGTGVSQRITQLGVDDLMRLPNHERAQMIEILEKLKRAQLSSEAA